MDNYGGSADQLVIMQIVTYNWGPTVDQLWSLILQGMEKI